MSVTEVMSAGDFRQRVTIDRRDELGILGEGINRMADDLTSLIGQATTDPTLAALLAEDLGPFLVAAQTSLGQSAQESDDEGLRRSANDGDWTAVLETATLALRSRLTKEA